MTLLKHAPAMGQVEAAPGQVETQTRKSKVGECRISYRLHFSSDNCPLEIIYILCRLTANGNINM